MDFWNRLWEAWGWRHTLLPERWFLRQQTRAGSWTGLLSALHLGKGKASMVLIQGEKTAVPSPQSTR